MDAANLENQEGKLKKDTQGVSLSDTGIDLESLSQRVLTHPY